MTTATAAPIPFDLISAFTTRPVVEASIIAVIDAHKGNIARCERVSAVNPAKAQWCAMSIARSVNRIASMERLLDRTRQGIRWW